MNATNPRLSVTLQPSLAAQLRKLSELTGNSQSAIIGDLLDGSGPVFDRLIQVLEAAKTAKESMRGKLADDLEQAQGKMENALGIVMEGFDQFTGSLLDEAEAVTRRARKAPAKRGHSGIGAAAPTPISNRGVRLSKTTTKTIASKPTASRPRAVKVTPKTTGGE
jgi:hypothetical protein